MAEGAAGLPVEHARDQRRRTLDRPHQGRGLRERPLTDHLRTSRAVGHPSRPCLATYLNIGVTRP